jgi:murein DD-endopeptidase MepM/ murein hydrolase activator NlpD
VTTVTVRADRGTYRDRMSTFRKTVVVALLISAVSAVPWARPAAAAGTWAWPVTGPVVRGFDPPDSPYGSGHRGIDVAAPIGTIAIAPADGTVAFAGPVGGRLFLTLDHGAGLESTMSWVGSLSVRRGDVVRRGDPVATTGGGHVGDPVANLHLGVRLDDVYVDPLTYLEAIDVTSLIRLAPLAP